MLKRKAAPKSYNIKWGIQRSTERGNVKPNHTNSLGYTKDENGKLIIVEDEAKTVQLIFDLYFRGMAAAKSKNILSIMDKNCNR